MPKSRTTKAAAKTADRKSAPPKMPSRSSGSSQQTNGSAAGSASAADIVDTQLAKYQSMRDFGVTAEPSGTDDVAKRRATSRTTLTKARSSGGLPFVIQKHAASHLHYDFRLGWSGVLKSWAVAKGPSYYTGDRRLAVQVEDHPMEYGGFEGIIPKGQYGGGTVMVWDQGTWWPQPGHENVDAGLREGSLKFEMHGSKMQGKWTLVRMHTTKPYSGADGRWKNNDKPQWLLLKEHDQFERPQTAASIEDEAPNSALTGRSMDEIASQEDHVWNSKETAGTGQAWYRQEAPSTNGSQQPSNGNTIRTAARKQFSSPQTSLPQTSLDLTAALAKLPAETQPEFLDPQLAQETETPPEGSDWLHELKLDGYRMQARKSGRGVQMLTRSGLDWTYRVQAIADAVSRLPVNTVTLDGEVVVLASDGTTNFADLQASFQQGERHPQTFFCFDLLHINGRNPRTLSQRERKQLLSQFVPTDEHSLVRLSEHIETGGSSLFEQACKLHAEGIVSKRADAPYHSGRNGDWLKAKCLHEQEFVIGGFSPSSDGPDRIGSLLLGYYRNGKLIYAGRTGTGFTQKMRKDLRKQLAPLETRTPPYARVPPEARRGGATWVKPQLVAQVRFATWTAEDFVRQAAFLGLREDKQPDEVAREEATSPPQPKSNGRESSVSTKPAARSVTKPPVGSDRHRPFLETTAPGTPGLVSETRVDPATTSVPPKKAAIRPSKSASPPPVRLTHPNKVLDPETGLTKSELADYYWAVAERMLPHIADRPLSLVRCPDGAGSPCFYQKHVNHMLPPGVGSVLVTDKKSGKPESYITLSSAEALAGLAQMGVLEVHPWGSRNEDLERPDRLIFDLDPDESLPWSIVTEAAREVRSRLKKIGLESFLKTTGGKGLHIVAPITPQGDFATVKDLAHRFVLAMERDNPRLYLTKMTKAARTGKIYLDYLRNERGATAVAPFSPRARPGTNASVPLDWTELDKPHRPSFPVHDFAFWSERLRRNPWKRLTTVRQNLDPARLRSL